MPEVKCEKDYDAFKGWKVNRRVDYANLMRIQKSMKKWGFDPNKPIHCTSDMTITDGQHRFIAAKNLGLPVYYVILDEEPNIEKIRDLGRASKAWGIFDYVTSYANQGNEHYKKLIKLYELSNLTWRTFLYSCLREPILGRAISTEQVKNGELFITDAAEERLLRFLSQLELFKGKFSAWDSSFFCGAFALVSSHPEYSHERMIEKIEFQESRLHKCPNTYYYIEMLQEIYNFQTRTKLRPDFIKDLAVRFRERY